MDIDGNEFRVIEPDNCFLADCGRFGSITCDGMREVGYFCSAALGLELVWDQGEGTAIRTPGQRRFVPKAFQWVTASTGLRRATPKWPTGRPIGTSAAIS